MKTFVLFVETSHDDYQRDFRGWRTINARSLREAVESVTVRDVGATSRALYVKLFGAKRTHGLP